jgi:hypothetical protein
MPSRRFATTLVFPSVHVADALDARANLGAELRRAVGHEGVRDPARLALTLLGAMRCASRAGYEPGERRRVVKHAVHAAIRPATPTDPARRRVAGD